jgi:hypothetical protein
MSLLRKLGVGSEKIIAQNNRVRGFVTSSETCWMFKVNKSAFRTHPLDGAVFPHYIRFTYSADGTEFTGERFFDAFSRSPQAGEVIDVCVDGGSPLKYAIQVQLKERTLCYALNTIPKPIPEGKRPWTT